MCSDYFADGINSIIISSFSSVFRESCEESNARPKMSLIGVLVSVFIYVLLPLVGFIYWWISKRQSYWKDRNVPGPEPVGLGGNMAGVGTEVSLITKLNEIYTEYKDKTPAAGFFISVIPQLLITDPELIKTIFIKDFAKFQDHGFYINERDDPLSAHVFNLEGAKWKMMRNKLTPTFTSGKLKMMYSSIELIGDRFVKALDKLAKEGEAFEVKDLSARFTTDVVGSTAFGIEINCLGGEGEEMFRIVKTLNDSFSAKNVVNLLKMMFPKFSRLIRLPLIPREVSNYFMNLTRETVDYRENNNVNRNDFLQLLIQLKNKGYVDGETGGKEVHKLTFDQIAAQAFVFLFAG